MTVHSAVSWLKDSNHERDLQPPEKKSHSDEQVEERYSPHLTPLHCSRLVSSVDPQ